MGLIDDKKDVMSTIGAYVSMSEDIAKKAGAFANLGKDTTNVFPSINNKEDIGSFLIDILGVVVGTTGLQQMTGELFTSFVDDAEDTLKTIAKKQLTTFTAGDLISDQTTFVNGLSVPVKDIDVYGKLKNNPQTEYGSLLYDVNAPRFDNVAFEAILNNGTPSNFTDFLSIEYDDVDDSFIFRPRQTDISVGEFISGYVDEAQIINKKEFIANIMDRIYGTISNNGDKTTEQLFNELQIDKLLQQVISGDDSYVISEDDYAELLKKAEELSDGVVYYDMGCGIVNAELPLSALTSFMNTVSGSTDPFITANATEGTIVEGFDTDDEEVSDENGETIKNGFFSRLIEFLKLELSKLLTTSPQARMLLALTSSFANEGIVKIENAKEDLVKFRTYINCIIEEALAMLYEFMFNLIVGLLVALLVPIIKEIILEKINQYIGLIKSLIATFTS